MARQAREIYPPHKVTFLGGRHMSSPTVAQELIGLLQKAGVDTVYGVTGDAVFPFFDALGRQQEGMRFIGTSTETSAAFMASYHAKLTGRLGVCIATSGPGAANLVNGLADAYFDQAPVLAITGQVASNQIGTGAKQDINQQQLFQAVTSFSQLVTSGETAVHVVARAIEKAMCESTVAHVSIPRDIFQHAPAAPVPNINMQVYQWRGGGFTGNIDDAVNMLRNAQNPLVVVGASDRSLRQSVENLADRLGAAIVVAQQAKGFVPDDHPRVLGGMGEAYIPSIIKEVDCILQIGTASFEAKYFAANVRMVQLVHSTGAIDYTRTQHALMGSIADAITALLDKLEPVANQGWQEQIAHEKENRNHMISEQRQNSASPIHPGHLMTVLTELVPTNALIVCDIGAYVHWFDSYFKAQEQTVLISSHWRSLGAGLPGALSAALQQSERRVIALVGDGGMMASLGELSTAVKYKIPVSIVVANNHHYEIERVKMEHQGLMPVGVEIKAPDFAALASSCGAIGKRVHTSDELRATLSEALGSDGPVVLDVQLARTGLPFLSVE